MPQEKSLSSLLRWVTFLGTYLSALKPMELKYMLKSLKVTMDDL